MNIRQLKKLGVPDDCVKSAIVAIQQVPGVYKNIEEVMRWQSDLVDIVGRFDPKIVKMCGDGSKAED